MHYKKLLAVSNALAKPKVNQLQVTRRVHHDVLRLRGRGGEEGEQIDKEREEAGKRPRSRGKLLQKRGDETTARYA
jgi:hypothetical protein